MNAPLVAGMPVNGPESRYSPSNGSRQRRQKVPLCAGRFRNTTDTFLGV